MLSSGVMMLSLVTAAMSDGTSPVLSSATHLRRDFSVFSHNKKVKLGHRTRGYTITVGCILQIPASDL